MDLITVGELYHDFIFHGLSHLPKLGEELKTTRFARSLGGGAPITAVTARRLGLRTGIVTIVGDRSQLDPLRAEKIDVRRSIIHPRGGMAITVAISTRRDRSFLSSEGPNADFEKLLDWEGVEPYLRSARHVHFCFRPRRWPAATALLRRLRAAGVTTSFDVSCAPGIEREAGFWKWLSSVTIFFPNLVEARVLTGLGSAPRALRALAKFVPLPVITMGARGAIAWVNGRAVHAPARRVRAVDSTGAGDAFAAGFLAAYLEKLPVEKCLERGNECGARAVTAPGGIH